MSHDAPDRRPHGDPSRPRGGAEPDDEPAAERSPSDLPAPEPIDGPDRSGDADPGAGAD